VVEWRSEATAPVPDPSGTSEADDERQSFLDPKTTAVVLIEYQNDFTSDGGALHGPSLT
jgi:hypothetical protein